ncbi:hypothetical protein IWQ60_008005 [Tieghemiomyces parasiticus]|uniref:Uncharacterized protein n=1 Tax=Tieghemiomyces parasiticus TaxID=78921 RepID=A0A9W7ZV32_9FUNG|nr:hypothetical protein IWQ60_008005 [Tieghemiomyces parasiticus]
MPAAERPSTDGRPAESPAAGTPRESQATTPTTPKPPSVLAFRSHSSRVESTLADSLTHGHTKALAQDSIRGMQPTAFSAATSQWQETELDAMLEWDDAFERLIRTTEEEFSATQNESGLELPPQQAQSPLPAQPPIPRHRPGLPRPPTPSVSGEPLGYPGSPAAQPLPPSTLTSRQPSASGLVSPAPGRADGPERDELAALHEELNALRAENRRAATEKESLLTQKYTHEGEIAIIRRRLVKSEAENTQLQERAARALTDKLAEKDHDKAILLRELDKVQTELNFKKQELAAAQMSGGIGGNAARPLASPGDHTARRVRSLTPRGTPAAVATHLHPPPSSPAPPVVSSPNGFLDVSAFYGPTPSATHPSTPERGPVMTVSVGVSTDPPPQPQTPPPVAGPDLTSAAKTSPLTSTKAPQSAATALTSPTFPTRPVADAEVPSGGTHSSVRPLQTAALLHELHTMYNRFSIHCNVAATDTLFAEVTYEVSCYRGRPCTADSAARFATYISSALTTTLNQSVPDPAKDLSCSLLLLSSTTLSLLDDALLRAMTASPALVSLPIEAVATHTLRPAADARIKDPLRMALLEQFAQWVAILALKTIDPPACLVRPTFIAQVLGIHLPNSILTRHLAVLQCLLLDEGRRTALTANTVELDRLLTALACLLVPAVSPAVQSEIVRTLLVLLRCNPNLAITAVLNHNTLVTALVQVLRTTYDHTVGLAVPCARREHFVVDLVNFLHALLTECPQACAPLMRSPSLLVPASVTPTPSAAEASRETTPLFYRYVDVVSRLAFGHDESTLLQGLVEKARDLLALVVTPQEEEEIMSLVVASDSVPV